LVQVPNDNITYKTIPGQAYSLGIFTQHMISEKTLIGADLLLSRMNAHDVNKDFDFGGMTGYSLIFDIQNNFEFTYLSLPIYCGVLWKDFELDLGLNIQYLLGAKGKYQIMFMDDKFTEDLDLKPDKYAIGVLLAVNYNITNSFAVALNYSNRVLRLQYQDIFDSLGDRVQQKRRFGMLTLGLNFNLSKVGEKK